MNDHHQQYAPAPPARANALGGAFGPGGRRDFLKLAAAAGAAIGLPAVLGGCHVLGAVGSRRLDFGDDFGVLNYAYVLETLEADFYTAVVANPPRDLRPGELAILADIAEHERQHKNFFKRALQVLRVHVPARDFSSINMASRDAVLAAARTFEDTGVGAYNGAGARIRLAEFLTIAGKIVSVEARHAATIRDLIDPGTRAFAGDDVVDADGLDRASDPGAVIASVQRFFREPLRVANV